jgi:hypothetical protein
MTQNEIKKIMLHPRSQYFYKFNYVKRSGTCLMSAKNKNYYFFKIGKKYFNKIYTDDIEFVENYLKFIERVTDTKIEYKLEKNYIWFFISLNKKMETNYNFNVYRALVLTRFLAVKYYFFYPLALMELNKYLTDTNEILYLSTFMLPASAYYSINNPFRYNSLNLKYDFINSSIITKFKTELKNDNNSCFNDFFIYNQYFKEISLKEKNHLHELLKNGLFKKACDYYKLLTNQNEIL